MVFANFSKCPDMTTIALKCTFPKRNNLFSIIQCLSCKGSRSHGLMPMSLTVYQAMQMFNRTAVQTHGYLSELICVCSVITLIAHSHGYVSVHQSDCRPV